MSENSNLGSVAGYTFFGILTGIMVAIGVFGKLGLLPELFGDKFKGLASSICITVSITMVLFLLYASFRKLWVVVKFDAKLDGFVLIMIGLAALMITYFAFGDVPSLR